MTSDQISRRRFQQLTAAAFGGLVAGAAAGCGRKGEPDGMAPPDGGDAPGGGGAAPPEGSAVRGHEDAQLSDQQLVMLDEPHVCRGLNACEGLGAGGDNACAGQGACATASHHDCHEMNECKGQGGCGETAGRNACQGQGECAVPLKETTWEKARQAYEQAMQAAGKSFDEPPPAS